jgi:hypothetical protein
MVARVVASGPAIFEKKILALLVAEFPQRFLKGVHPRCRGLFRPQKANSTWPFGLLRTRRERPRGRRTAE